MNAKKAKAYRQLTHAMIIEGSVNSGPWATYKTKNYTKPITRSERDANGKLQNVTTVGQFGQVTLDPKSPKGMYRRLKREGVESVFRSL